MLIRYLILSILFLWWISPPDSEAVIEASSLQGYALVKVILRILIVIYVIPNFLFNIKKFSWALKGYIVWIWIFILWSGITILLSGNKFYSLYRWIETLTIFLLSIILIHKINFKKTERFIDEAFMIASIFIIAAIILFWYKPEWGAKFSGFELYSGEVKLRLGGYFLRTDIIAGLSQIIFLYYFYRLINKVNLKLQIINIIFLFISFLALFLSYSRTVLISTILCLSYTIWKAKRNYKVKFIWTFLVIIGALNINLFIDWITRQSSIEEILALNSRIYLWKDSISELIKSPFIITGYGYLTNSREGLSFYVPEMERIMTQPHSGFVAVLLGTGLFGFLLVLVIVKSWFKIRKKLLKAEIHFPIEAIHIVNLGALIHTLMDYGIFGVPNSEMFFFFYFFILAHKVSFFKKGNYNDPITKIS